MKFYSIVLCFLFLAISGHTQQFVEFNGAKISKALKKQEVDIILSFKIAERYHIQSELESLDGSIATKIAFDDNDSFEIISNEFTFKQNQVIVLNQYAHNVLTDEFEVTVRLKLNKKTLNFKNLLKGILSYQACTDKQCLFPRDLDFKIQNIL